MYKFLSILIFVISLTSNTSAQKAEQLLVHFDKNFYVAGEDAWYKIYFTNSASEIESSVVHIEWLTPNGRVIEQQNLPVKDNYTVGDLAIPYDWTEGNYLFQAYTVAGLNYGQDNHFRQVIPVFNLAETPVEITKIDSTLISDSDKEEITKSDLDIELIFDKNRYKKGEEVAVKIVVKGNQGTTNLSMAVADGNYVTNNTQLSFSNPILGTPSTNKTQNYTTEKGIILKAKLTDDKGALLDTRFLSIYNQSTKSFYQTTVKDGALSFQLPDYQGLQNIQLFDMNPFHEPIPQIEWSKGLLKNSYRSKKLVRNEAIANYLFLLSKFRQYNEVFKVANPDYQVDSKQEKQTTEPDRSYPIENFKSLSDMRSFAKEVINGARVVDNKGLPSIRLRYAEKNTHNRRSPWYMVNDWLTTDESQILKLPFRDFERIDMFNSKKKIGQYLDPSMISRGLLSLYTKDGKTPKSITQKANNLAVDGFYPQRSFPTFDKSKGNPDFRPMIYWNPNISTNAQGEVMLKFNSSDTLGTFYINVMGVDEEGRVGNVTGQYLVEFEVN